MSDNFVPEQTIDLPFGVPFTMTGGDYQCVVSDGTTVTIYAGVGTIIVRLVREIGDSE